MITRLVITWRRGSQSHFFVLYFCEATITVKSTINKYLTNNKQSVYSSYNNLCRAARMSSKSLEGAVRFIQAQNEHACWTSLHIKLETTVLFYIA